MPQEDVLLDPLSVLLPDTRAVLLLSMEPGVYYSRKSLVERVAEFSGGSWPLGRSSTWSLIRSEQEAVSLSSQGFVDVAGEFQRQFVASQYATLTDKGEKLGQIWAAMAVRTSNEMRTPLRSMTQIFGKTHFKGKRPKAYVIADLIEHVATHKGAQSITDISDAIGLKVPALRSYIEQLAQVGIIHTGEMPPEATQRYYGIYRLNGQRDELMAIDAGRLAEQIREEIPYFKSDETVAPVQDWIVRHPRRDYVSEWLAEEIGSTKSPVRAVLRGLKATGYLTSRTVSQLHFRPINCTTRTEHFYENLLRPIAHSAEDGKVNRASSAASGAVRWSMDRERVRAEVTNFLAAYAAENSASVHRLGRHVRNLGPGEYTPGEFLQSLRAAHGAVIHRTTAVAVAANAIRRGELERTAEGYRRIEPQ